MQQGDLPMIKNDLESILATINDVDPNNINVNDLVGQMDDIDHSMDHFIDQIDTFQLKLESLLQDSNE